jgi:proline dehydrogenase
MSEEERPMKNYKVKWTTWDGERKTSHMAYDESTAHESKKILEDRGLQDVEVVEVEPGE